MIPPISPGQSPIESLGKAPGFDPNDTLDQLILSPFPKQNIKSKHNVKTPPSC